MNARDVVDRLRTAEGTIASVRQQLRQVSEQGATVSRQQIHELAAKLESAEQTVSSLREYVEGPKAGPVTDETTAPEGEGSKDPMSEPARVGGAPVSQGDGDPGLGDASALNDPPTDL